MEEPLKPPEPDHPPPWRQSQKASSETASSSSGAKPSTAVMVDLTEEREQVQLLSHFTGGSDKLLQLLILCRQHGDVCTEVALQAARDLVKDEANLKAKALAVEKSKRLEEEQQPTEAQRAEVQRKELMLKVELAKQEAQRQAAEAEKSLKAAKAAEDARNEATKKAAEAAEAAQTAEALRKTIVQAADGQPEQVMNDAVMILGPVIAASVGVVSQMWNVVSNYLIQTCCVQCKLPQVFQFKHVERTKPRLVQE